MGIIKELASAGTGSQPKRAKVSLAEIHPTNGNIIGTRSFQYFPETITDNRSVDLEAKYGVGSSHPIYQWTRGSSREISFETVFTSENRDKPNQPKADDWNSLTDQLEGLAKLGQSKPAIGGLVSKKEDPYTVNVAAAIAWLRSKTYPFYANKVAYPPPILLLYLEGSGVNSFVGNFHEDVIPCIMTRCDITYESFFDNGKPRVVTANVTFAETIQYGTNWKYVDRTDYNRAWTNTSDPSNSYAQYANNGETPPSKQIAATAKNKIY